MAYTCREALIVPMRLTLDYHLIADVQCGETTRLHGATLHVDQEALRQHLLEDRRLASVDVYLVGPGERCRFGVVFDIVEPRAHCLDKYANPETVFRLWA